MNKEDIWVSRVPLPIRYAVTGAVHDDFENIEVGKNIPDWNTYSPLWARVDLVKAAYTNSIQLKDKDPYDYARAIRVFQEGEEVLVKFKVQVRKVAAEPFEIDITDRYGNRPVRISLEPDGKITAHDGSTIKTIGTFDKDQWLTFEIRTEATPYGEFSVLINGKAVAENFELAESVKSVERISFRTGKYRDLPSRTTPNEDPEPPSIPVREPPMSANWPTAPPGPFPAKAQGRCRAPWAWAQECNPSETRPCPRVASWPSTGAESVAWPRPWSRPV